MQTVESLFTVETSKSYRLLFGPTLGYWLAIFQFLKPAKLVENDWQEWCDENNARKRACSANDLASCQRNERGSERSEHLIIDNALRVISPPEDDLALPSSMTRKNRCTVNDEILKHSGRL